MSVQGQRAAEPWQNPAFAASWAEADGRSDLLELPRRIAADLVGIEHAPDLVIDIASGPGSFLETFLVNYPNCRGIWYDASNAMLGQGRSRLARFCDRVDFQVGDMTALTSAPLLGGADAVMTSRAAHHLDSHGLRAFYRDAANLVKPSGWLINLDHIGPPEDWNRLLRTVRPHFVGPSSGPKHHHNYPLTSVTDHLAAFANAGITDVEIVWRAFYTCLFVGRKPAE
jgi:SAM-dependent methyltransferase